MPENERVNLRMHLVDTDRRGVQRVADATEPVRISDQDLRNFQQIHPGRLQLPTDVPGDPGSSRIVAQVLLKTQQIIIYLLILVLY